MKKSREVSTFFNFFKISVPRRCMRLFLLPFVTVCRRFPAACRCRIVPAGCCRPFGTLRRFLPEDTARPVLDDPGRVPPVAFQSVVRGLASCDRSASIRPVRSCGPSVCLSVFARSFLRPFGVSGPGLKGIRFPPPALRATPQSRNPSRTSCSRMRPQSATGRFTPSMNRKGQPSALSSM